MVGGPRPRETGTGTKWILSLFRNRKRAAFPRRGGFYKRARLCRANFVFDDFRYFAVLSNAVPGGVTYVTMVGGGTLIECVGAEDRRR